MNITQEQLQQAQQLQEKLNNTYLRLGELTLAISELEAEKQNLFATYQEIKAENQAFVDTISQQYGNGTINLETGAFTPDN